jgi:hypothetical protein
VNDGKLIPENVAFPQLSTADGGTLVMAVVVVVVGNDGAVPEVRK